jgi:hypothetical protein
MVCEHSLRAGTDREPEQPGVHVQSLNFFCLDLGVSHTKSEYNLAKKETSTWCHWTLDAIT